MAKFIKFLFKRYFDDVELVNFWFLVVRIVSGLVFLLGITVFWKLNWVKFDPMPVLLLILPLYVLVNIFWFVFRKHKFVQKVILDSQLFLDIATLTYVVYIFGPIHRSIVFLYVLPVASASLISPIAPLFAGLTSLLFLGGVIFFSQPNLSSPILLLNSDEKLLFGILIMLMINIIFYGVYHMERIKRAEAETIRIKDDFLFRTAHDVQAPFTSIRWMVEKMSQPQFLSANPGVKEYLNRINELNRRVTELIHDLLQVAKGTREDVLYKSEKVDLRQITDEILKEMEPSITEKNISVEYKEDSPVLVVGDSDKIREVVVNLLGNSIKYNKLGGIIKISHQHEGKFLRTSFWNNGKEISADQLSKLFSPFFRASDDGQITGTGLGLYIVKHLVEKMGGRVFIKSGPDQGTEVGFYLPADGP